MADTTSSDYPCNCRSCGTIISPSVTDMCEDCEIAAERNYEKFYTPMTDPDFVDIFDPDPDFVDIVTMLRGADRLEPCMCAAAADEIERLRKERDEAIALIENIAKEVNVLSTRPAAIIKFSDLVDQINEWGDTARNILDKKANTND